MRIYLTLSEGEKEALEGLLKRSPKPYLRERASAILQIASGSFGNEVASKGLLRRRRKNTVYDWVVRYKAAGIKGLEQKAGRGRKPGFSPSKPSTTTNPG
jgi:transposase